MDRAGVRAAGLCGLALRDLPDFRLHRKGIRRQHAGGLAGRGPAFYNVHQPLRRELPGLTLLYTPCIAAVATIRREFDSTLKTIGIVLMQCCVAWIAASVVYALIGIL